MVILVGDKDKFFVFFGIGVGAWSRSAEECRVGQKFGFGLNIKPGVWINFENATNGFIRLSVMKIVL